MNNNSGIFRLCFKNVPYGMKICDLTKLCSEYGKVINFTANSQKTSYKFIDFASWRDMQNVYEALRKNSMGIVVDIANATKKDPNYIKANNNKFNDDENAKTLAGRTENYDLSDQISNSSTSKEDTNSNPALNKIRKCVACNGLANKKCQRCGDFYCSVECQTKDWNEHRYICIPMPNLIDVDDGISCDKATENHDLITENHKYDCKEKYNISKEKNSNQLNVDIVAEKDNKNNEPLRNKNDNLKSDQKQNVHSVMADSIQVTEKNKEMSNRKVTGKIVFADLPPNRSNIMITSIAKTNLLFIRSTDSGAEYVSMLQKINLEAENSKELKKLPVKGEILISDYDESYYRVLVHSVENENDITVLFIDFGNVEKKKITELRTLPIEVMNFKCHTLSVYLKNVPDVPITQSVIDYMNLYIDCFDKKVEIIYDEKIKREGKLEVELRNVDSNEILNEKIIELIKNDSGNKGKNIQKTVFFTKNDIEHKLIPNSENVSVIVFDNSKIQEGFISCISTQDVEPLFKFCEQLSTYVEASKEAYKPRKSELCIALSADDDGWYRAECIEVDNDYCQILFIDFGNESRVHINQIRKYPENLLYPCRTNLCMIADLPPKLSQAAINEINTLIELNESICIPKISNTVTKNGKINVLHIPEVIKKLKMERLI